MKNFVLKYFHLFAIIAILTCILIFLCMNKELSYKLIVLGFLIAHGVEVYAYITCNYSQREIIKSSFLYGYIKCNLETNNLTQEEKNNLAQEKIIKSSFLFGIYSTAILSLIYLLISSNTNSIENIFSFIVTVFISLIIAIYLYLDAKKTEESQKKVMDAIHDSTRNHIDNFSEIFARQLKMMLDMKINGTVKEFKYVNFFLNFGEVYTMFPKYENKFEDASKKVGLLQPRYKDVITHIVTKKSDYEKLKNKYRISDHDNVLFEVDGSLVTAIDLKNFRQCVKLFQLLLMEIIDTKDSEFHVVLVADDNIDLDKMTQYYNRSYEISTLTIKIIMEQSAIKIQDGTKISQTMSIDKIKDTINNKVYNENNFNEDLLTNVSYMVSEELQDINFHNKNNKIEHMLVLDKVSNLFDFNESIEEEKKKDVLRLNNLLCDRCPDSKGRYRQHEINRLKSKVFSSLEAIYYLLTNSNVHTKENYVKLISYYILYSQQINKFLIAEYRRRKVLIEHIKNSTILVNEKRKISFINKSHFPYQGSLGYVAIENGATAPATLIFFIGGDTVGKTTNGYYSEQINMFNLHQKSFDNTVRSNIGKMFHHVEINLNHDDVTDIINDINCQIDETNKNTKSQLNENELLLYLIKAGLNFRFWIDENNYWGDDGKGSDTLFRKLDNMVEEELDYLVYFTNLKKNEFKEKMIDEGNRNMPALDEKYKFIKIIIEYLNNNNTLENMLIECDKDAIKIIYYLTETLPFKDVFEDYIEYKGEEILVAKKATYFVKQLVKSGAYDLKNLEYLNILADYKIPQYLSERKIFKYSPELKNKIDNKVLLDRDSLMEQEIRLATIQFSRILLSILQSQDDNITMLDIDEYIWRKSQDLKNKKNVKPFHLAETTKY